MAIQSGSSFTTKHSMMPAVKTTYSSWRRPPPREMDFSSTTGGNTYKKYYSIIYTTPSLRVSAAVDRNTNSSSSSSSNNANNNNNNNNNSNKKSSSSSMPNSNYVVPLDKSSCITRPLAEILRDLNKRVPDNIVKPDDHDLHSTTIPWYHANRMLSFYAPGWCGEIRDVIFSDNGSVTVVYRVTIRGSDGEAHRESTGTVSCVNADIVDPVAAAEQIAFCKACARFGLGLYLFHEE